MKIQIAGPGCARCQTTEKIVINTCAQLDLAADVSHIYDVKEIAKLGIMSTPAVIVDGKIVMSGRVPTVGELKAILSQTGTAD
jgi:small redox-active disulfide protein 2